MTDIFVRLIKLPHCMKGVSRENSDGTYTIVLNSGLTHEQQQETLRHELEHIENDDFRATETADDIERMRH